MISTAIFLGPSLPRDEARALLPEGGRLLPPAARGDLWQAVKAGAGRIALVDGVFQRLPSVPHKEILWALSQGVEVWGAASMGAIRAAELASFGMLGLGQVFEGFRSGALAADDEVAVGQGPAELDFAALTEPLVNVRSTLDRLGAEGVVTRAEAGRLLAAARSLYFLDRSWPRIVEAAGLDPDLVGAAARFRRDLKAEDARLLLSTLARTPVDAPPPIAFEETRPWTLFLCEVDNPLIALTVRR